MPSWPHTQPNLSSYARAARARVIFVAATLLIVGGLGATEASAETPAKPAMTMDAHYAAGKAALKAQELDGALKHFRAALEMTDGDERAAWQMLLAIAVTYQRKDEPGFAIEYYKRFLKRSNEYRDALTVKWSQRRERAVTDIAALEAKTKATHGFVTVVSDPSGAAIFLGDVQAGAAQDATTTFGMYLRAGQYTITLRLPGHTEVSRTVDVAKGKLVAMREILLPLKTSPPVPQSVPPPAPSMSPSTSVTVHASTEDPINLGPWITMSVGGATFIATAVLGFLAGDANERLAAVGTGDTNTTLDGTVVATQTEEWDSLKAKKDGYMMGVGVTAGIGAAAVAGGLLWFFLDPSESEDTASTRWPRLEMTPTSGGAMGHALWRF